MSQLPLDKALELKRLENIATEKRIAYQKIDTELFTEDGTDKTYLLPQYTKARTELTEAVNNYNTYKAALAKTYVF